MSLQWDDDDDRAELQDVHWTPVKPGLLTPAQAKRGITIAIIAAVFLTLALAGCAETTGPDLQEQAAPVRCVDVLFIWPAPLTDTSTVTVCGAGW